ncbi:MAG: DUF3054 domain-containing protein [Natrialbaceae archaeon]|nr:DUF3054 domain-containing protein [Natrialbaceae archaeon]
MALAWQHLAMAYEDGIPRSRRGWAIAGGDVLVIATLVLVGQLNHGVDPLETPLYSIIGIGPFVSGWLVAALLSGVYAQPTLERGGGAKLVTVTWLGAANIGLILRTSPAIPGGVTWPFGVVITGFGLIALLLWRGGLSVWFSGKFT